LSAFPPEPPAPHWESIDSAEQVPTRARRHRRPPRRLALVLAAIGVTTVMGSGVAAASWLAPTDLDRDLSTVRALGQPAAAPADQGGDDSSADDQLGARADDPSPSPSRASRSGDRAAPTDPATTAAAAATTTPAARSASAEDQVLALVNTARATAGCRALTFDARLTKAARGHSADMAQRDYFAHDTPEGASSGDRVTDAGYRWSMVGENIAAGQPNAAEVMDDWMHSSGHRANILNCGYRNLGVGLIRDGNGKIYWTQDFGTLR
jgi:uncharacterized protein YkwD